MTSTTPTHLADRALIRLSGDDPAGFLQGLVTQDVTGALPVWSGLLTAQGKTLFDLLVWPDGAGGLLIDCEAICAEALCKRLTLYRLRRQIVIEPVSEMAAHWAPAGDAGVPDPRLAELGRRWLAPAGAGGDASGAWRQHRLALGVCEGAAELADILWLETNAAELNGVSFTKGCYIGQENTARMNWRSKVNRRLMVVPLAASDPKRQRVAYSELALAVDHLRVEDIPAGTAPPWLESVLA
ncbi:CAF17-like 4Fe-4S cluster assembly/insertion protein YgfZ [Qipengyuania sp. YIM B01966]|uniref:CAF17-like 4Fe-4S cluster assembly/insertion protein YgfZ n=1 Tax=Qipengyuania sp. YIM B01966 TaxID=2778646 RepID=UPI0018F3A2E0|nr:folate-binding protein YgfZ [Qipengyuania sp. YIM B01966]